MTGVKKTYTIEITNNINNPEYRQGYENTKRWQRRKVIPQGLRLKYQEFYNGVVWLRPYKYDDDVSGQIYSWDNAPTELGKLILDNMKEVPYNIEELLIIENVDPIEILNYQHSVGVICNELVLKICKLIKHQKAIKDLEELGRLEKESKENG